MLGTSPFQVLSQEQQQQIAAITPELLRGVVAQLAGTQGLDVAALLAEVQAAAQPTTSPLEAKLQEAAAADASSPAALLMSALRAGVPCVAATASREELAALSDVEAAALRATAARLQAAGKALEALVVMPPGSGDCGPGHGESVG
jgi:hypothetical protein